VLGAPPQGTVAAAAGLRSGDTVRAVAGEPISTWQELRWRVLQSALQRSPLALEVVNERGHLNTVTLDLRSFPTDDVESDALERIGLRLYRPPLEPLIGQIVRGGAAWEALVAAVQARPEMALELRIERGGTTQSVEVVPAAVSAGGKRIGRIGAAPQMSASHAEKMLIRVQHGPFESLWKALVKTGDIAVFSLKMLGKMLLGEVSWKHLSGPVTIADFAGQSAAMGWVSYLTFLALISISLGVLNLLPIPLLDGGHLMYYAIELVKGKPVSERAMELGQRVGLALLLVMMAFAFYNDLNRLLTG
jgi:regulator of sigma E protease